jgi:hypothetical protein
MVSASWIGSALAPCKEGEVLKDQAKAYRRRHFQYPEVICADRIYRTSVNRAFCQSHGIRLSGLRLGRPESDPQLATEAMRQFLSMISFSETPLKGRSARGSADLNWG